MGIFDSFDIDTPPKKKEKKKRKKKDKVGPRQRKDLSASAINEGACEEDFMEKGLRKSSNICRQSPNDPSKQQTKVMTPKSGSQSIEERNVESSTVSEDPNVIDSPLLFQRSSSVQLRPNGMYDSMSIHSGDFPPNPTFTS